MTQGAAGRPGKIIAVHLNYPSRAAQRGRRPAAPVLLPQAAQLARGVSGGTVERPGGHRAAGLRGRDRADHRHGRPPGRADDGWAHVGGVTAANDLGLYDLRAADRGSNLRAKGGDGFTPLGPALHPRGRLDPAALRVRTWVNGDAGAGGHHGRAAVPVRPAGRRPVPADHPRAGRRHPHRHPGRLDRGRARGRGRGRGRRADRAGRAEHRPARHRRWSRASAPRPLPVGAQPAVDDVQRHRGLGLAPRPPGLRRPRSTLDHRAARPAARRCAGRRPCSAQLRKRGLDDVTIDGVRPPRPAALVGRARTLRFVPHREDLFAAHGGGLTPRSGRSTRCGPATSWSSRPAARPAPGRSATSSRCAPRRAARPASSPTAACATSPPSPPWTSPSTHAGAHPAVLGRRHVPWDADLTIACGGATVQPGDVIVGDDDGVLVIPPDLVEEVLAAALEQETEEQLHRGPGGRGRFGRRPVPDERGLAEPATEENSEQLPHPTEARSPARSPRWSPRSPRTARSTTRAWPTW